MFGSLPINLVSDFGTIEHVDNQYQVFKNVHDVCIRNGVIIHTLPTLNYWKDHCKYFYSKEFFVELARLCDYKILDLEIKYLPRKRCFSSKCDIISIITLNLFKMLL